MNMSPANKKSKCGKIAAQVRKKAGAGVTIREIFASIQGYQNAPRSMATFYKHYRDDIETARGDVTEKIANKVIHNAIENNDFKSQELWLTTKGGWSKQQTNTNIKIDDDIEDKNSALDTLLSKLGFIEDDEKD